MKCKDLIAVFSGTTLGSVQSDEITSILVSAMAAILVIIVNAVIAKFFGSGKTKD
jgi:hypothetical protein